MKIIISNASRESIYEQITDQIRKQIIIGNLKEKEMLPPIIKLATEL